ncbi:Peroxisomal NADH pyrophosphatase nudt12 [Rhizoclosmatium sp. JEL0117]|nr:Peroxisomal NADH pyrophosphatase nudt12 [Rhizoclosmatium sp. JEL0117]
MASAFELGVAAIQGNRSAALEALLQTQPHVARETNARKWTLLHFAGRFGVAEAVGLLTPLSDIGALTDDGKTAAALASDWGHAALFADLAESSSKAEAAAASTAPLLAASHLSNTELLMHFGATAADRAGELRSNPAALATMLFDKATRICFLAGRDIVLTTKKSLLWLHASEVDRLVNDPNLSATLLNKHELLLLATNRFALNIEFMPLLKSALIQFHQVSFENSRPAAYTLPSKEDAAYLAQAASILDWQSRIKFCALCGAKMRTIEAGYKKLCSDESCHSHKSVQNTCFPRTDPVAIVCIVSVDGEKVLLGRQKIWPAGMYSCIAGFMEPGETMEAAARREAKEEAGVVVGRVQYYASQPWPFPANLMLGMYGQAVMGGETVSLVDKELEDARWFTRREILDSMWGKPAPVPGGALLKMAQPYAIAYHLLKNWAEQPTFQWTVESSGNSTPKQFTYEDYVALSSKY